MENLLFGMAIGLIFVSINEYITALSKSIVNNTKINTNMAYIFMIIGISILLGFFSIYIIPIIKYHYLLTL